MTQLINVSHSFMTYVITLNNKNAKVVIVLVHIFINFIFIHLASCNCENDFIVFRLASEIKVNKFRRIRSAYG